MTIWLSRLGGCRGRACDRPRRAPRVPAGLHDGARVSCAETQPTPHRKVPDAPNPTAPRPTPAGARPALEPKPEADGPRERHEPPARASRRFPTSRRARRAGARAPRTSSSSAPRSRARRGGSDSSSSIPTSCSRPSSARSCTSSTDSGGRGRTRTLIGSTTATSRAPRASSSARRRPEYLSCAWAAPMVALAAPEARAIVLLRDPVERYVSGLSHQDRGGLIDEAEVEGERRALRRPHARRHRRHRPGPVRDPDRVARAGLPPGAAAHPPVRALRERTPTASCRGPTRSSGLAPHRAAGRGAGAAAQHGQAREARRPGPAPRAAARYYRPEVRAPARAGWRTSTCRSGRTSPTSPEDRRRQRSLRSGLAASRRHQLDHLALLSNP